MTTSQRRSALVAGVAHALSFAIDDPAGHKSWALSQHQDSPCKRLRGATETQRSATVFDSSAIPPISIDKYLMRLRSTFKCSDASFIAALIVVDRLLEYDGGRLPLTQTNVHRIFLASLVVAVKYHEDLVYSNSHYAKSGGVHLKEVNRLERVLLAALDFHLRILPEQYSQYEAALLALCEHRQQKGAGVTHQPLPTEGAVAFIDSAVETQKTEVLAPPQVVAPPPVVAPATTNTAKPDEALSTPVLTAPPWPAVISGYDSAVRHKMAALAARPSAIPFVGRHHSTKSRSDCLRLETCVPWVPLDRAILNLELEMLAVPASR